MRRKWVPIVIWACVAILGYQESFAQQQYSVGGRAGLSIFSSGGSSAGLQIGPTFDINFGGGKIAGTDFNINTQDGTPIEWAYYFKYLIDVSRSDIIPFVNGGFSLWFYTGGPYFGFRFGGGAYFPIAKNISIPADIQLGPVFTSGSSTFYFAMTSGIRYTLP
ncbi:MAG: hypothetical protein HY033_13820 [Ignavibacteriae bacterium]|nr:hypothetical protein [Ignavibacteria bacterium]MBI3365967.1 hypothetical protein [Ignavibacteriota bacterium]